MLKRFLLAVATVACCSTSIFAQDVFLSFDNDALTTSTTLSSGSTGTGFVFSAEGLVHRGFDLFVNGSDGAVAQFTDAEVFVNGATPADPLPSFGIGPVLRFDGENSTVNGDGTQFDFNAGALLGVGVDGGTQFDPAVAGVGVLLGEFEFTVDAAGSSTFSLAFNDIRSPGFGFTDENGFGAEDTTEIGSGITVTVEGAAIPEPTSTGLLAMGLIGLVARRRR